MRGLTDWHTIAGATPDDFLHPHDAPHPPRAYYAGAMPPVEPYRPAHPRLPLYLAIAAAFLASFALVGFLLSHSTNDPQTPTVATENPRETQPLASPQQTPATQPAASQPATTADPYDVWQATKPAGAPNLSRDDAMARAMLGAGQTWPAGTTDAALQAAYASMLKGE